MKMALRLGVGLLVLLCPLWALGQEPMLIFDGCSILGGNEVMYYFFAKAGADTVNDIHVCVYDAAGSPIPVLMTSQPPCWASHVDIGSNCIHYWATPSGLPILPGQTYGKYDFVLPPGHCIIVIRWMFTLNGVQVTPWFTCTWTCSYTDAAPETWGSIKALYR